MTDHINPIVYLPHRVLLIAAQNIIMQNEQISGWNSQVSAHRPWSTLQVVSPSLDLIDSTNMCVKRHGPFLQIRKPIYKPGNVLCMYQVYRTR